MARRSGFEGLFRQVTDRYQAGDVLDAVNGLLRAAQAGEKWAVQCLAYLYEITSGLENLFEKSAITLDTDPIGKLRNELDKWARKKTVSAPSKTSANTIVVNVKKIEDVLRDSNLASELQPLQTVSPEIAVAGGKIIILPPDDTTRYIRSVPESTTGLEAMRETALDATAPVAADRIERTPHLDLKPDGPLSPQASVHVEVYVDRNAPRAGEKTETVVVDQDADVEVQLLTTAHFSIEGSGIGSVHIAKDEDKSNAAKFFFKVKARKDLPKDEVPTVTALFFHTSRPCGSVAREVEITGYRVELPPAAERVESPPPVPPGEPSPGPQVLT